MTLDELRGLAVRAAAAAGEVIVRAMRELPALDVQVKGRGDYVTAVDRAAEKAALAVLREGTPDISTVAEESAADAAADTGRVWVVDPLDGTTNFLRGFPVVGVSVGLLEDGLPVVGVVAAPRWGAWWCAARGQGAHDDQGRRLSVRAGGGGGVAATGFPFRAPQSRPRYLAVFEPALETSEDLRRAGAASLDLAYTAAGTFDGFFELGLSPWDIAAGSLLVTEAGGVVSDWSGDARAVYRSGDILAGTPAWHERMLDICRASARAFGPPMGAPPSPVTARSARGL